MLDNLQTCCNKPRINGLAVTLPGDENFTDAASDSLVQNFIYLLRLSTGDTYGCPFPLVKLVIYRRDIISSSL